MSSQQQNINLYEGEVSTDLMTKIKSKNQKINLDAIDAVLMLILLILGSVVAHLWWDLNWYGYSVTILSGCYIAAILAYVYLRKIKPQTESWFWLVMLILVSASYTFYDEHMIFGRFFLLFFLCFYWTVTVFNGLLQKQTTNIFLLDMINMKVTVPLSNLSFIFHLPKQLFHHLQFKQIKKNPKLFSIMLGVLLSIPLLAMIIPLLVQADSTGVFFDFFKNIITIFRKISQHLMLMEAEEIVWKTIFTSILVIYLTSFVFGYAHKRYIEKMNISKHDERMKRIRILPNATISTVLVIILALYVVFIVTQFSYFFSAFIGKLPDQQGLYSENARSGFFELCRIVILNLVIVCVSNGMSKVRRQESMGLRIENIVLSVITILLIGTAASKMFLYIHMLGLTTLRIYVCLFLVFLFCVWVGFILLQKQQFSIVRFALSLGVAMSSILCLVNIPEIVNNYNQTHGFETEQKQFMVDNE